MIRKFFLLGVILSMSIIPALAFAESGEIAGKSKEGRKMTTFIMRGRYTSESIKQISAERTTKANEIVKQCEGKIVAVYATLGDADLLVIAEFPGVNELIKASVALNKALGISFSSDPAITVEEFDKLVGGK